MHRVRKYRNWHCSASAQKRISNRIDNVIKNFSRFLRTQFYIKEHTVQFRLILFLYIGSFLQNQPEDVKIVSGNLYYIDY